MKRFSFANGSKEGAYFCCVPVDTGLIRVCCFLIVFISLFGCHDTKKESIVTADVCVLGGSEAGFCAAIQASRLGKKVVLIEPTGHPGGMLVEGLGKDIRFGSGRVIGGIAREFYMNVEKYYGLKADFDNPEWYSKYEPSIAEKVIEEMLNNEDNIRIIRNVRIDESNGVEKDREQIIKILLENGQQIKAKIYIDASIEGHLLHFAGITSQTIREGNKMYGESLNGIQTENTFRQFELDIDPFIIKGDSASGLIETIQKGNLGEFGEPSKYIQGYCFRMCLTNDAANRIAIEKPQNYNPDGYEIYRRYLDAGGELFKPYPNRHNNKTDIGSWHDLSANLYGQNWQYPTGNYKIQDSIVKYHRDFTLGLLWFLQNDKGVNSTTRKNWTGWGLPKDEFEDNGHWPRRLYIRSGRRMVSDYVITQHNADVNLPDKVEDPVAIAWWPPDMHHARRIVKDGFAYNEGFTHVGDNKNWKPFKISYKSMVPKKRECTNLISPTCVSSSYVGYGSIRIVPTFMVLGQSAGAASSVAIDEKVTVQDVPYTILEKTLLAGSQILMIPDNWLEIIMANN